MALTDKSERQLLEMIADNPELAEPEVTEVDPFEVDPEEIDVEVVENADGGATVDLGTGGGEYSDMPFPEDDHYANLAEYLDDTTLSGVATELDQEIENDLRSRAEWEDTLIQAQKQLGFKLEDKNTPWAGACSVVHPLLSEAVIRFQSDTISSILPSKGPVKGNIIGLNTPERIAQANRVSEYMNYTLMNEMEEYRPETERLLFGLALNGAAFRKFHENPVTGKPKSVYIPAPDLIVNNDATDLNTADRITHRMRLSRYEVDRLVRAGFYRDTTLHDPFSTESDWERAVDDLVGMDTVTPDTESRTVYECQCYWDFGEDPDGAYLPYVVTVDKTEMTVLSIYRNWDAEDEKRFREHHIVHYEFIPGLGFYGFGYSHLVGNTAKAATSILQQLVDSGTLANVQGGFKSRSARMTQDDGPVMPGEWRDVDVPSNKLSEHFFPMPSKEPSGTLFQLMQSMVDNGRRLASAADLKIDEMNERAPVGTTLAIMERAQKMQTAIQHRIHAALKREFKILARLLSRTVISYPYETDEGEEIAASDFDDRVDVIPVSDPDSSSLSHLMMKYQALLTAAQQAPDVYDVQLLNRKFAEAIGIEDPDKIVPTPEDTPGRDPISENAAILNLGKVAAKMHQDHDAHLRVHMALQKDPALQQMLQNSPSGASISGALDAHIREHVAFKMRREIEEEIGVELPHPDQPLPEDVEARLSRMAADAADQLTGKKQAQQQAQEQAAQQQDPVIQMKQQELQIQAQEQQRKAQKDQMDFARHQQKAQMDAQMSAQQAQMEMQMKMIELAQKAQQAQADDEIEKAKMILSQITELAQMQRDQMNKGVEAGLRIGEMIEGSNQSDPESGE